jgi:2,4-dienoyl-CoA reductase-like NADH-dependent reductase (Old Yellow Enzyme family)
MKLFSPFQLRELTFSNRVFVSPMCQYSAEDGVPNEWHLVHYGTRAVGGAGLVMAEATAVSPEGRISPSDLGLWNDEQAREFMPITKFILENGAVPGVQLAHAGRKASTAEPWNGAGPLLPGQGGWTTLAPSSLPFAHGYSTPKEASELEIDMIVKQFVKAAKRALAAGFQVIELHMAHGYLLHQFLSPLTNLRMDDFGGEWEGRARLPLLIAKEVRRVWPEKWPIFVRVSSTDWVDGGWDLKQTIRLAKALKLIGIDLIDCSSGGLVHNVKFQTGPGFQVPFAEEIKREAEIATGAVGFITDPHQAEEIISAGKADAVFLARQLLRDPYWPLHAAKALGAEIDWPKQYLRAK